MKRNGFLNVMFWLVYAIAALAAWFHTFYVFRMTDNDFIAALSATAIDGVFAFLFVLMANSRGYQRTVGLIGIGIYAGISATAQAIWRYQALGVELPQSLLFFSRALVPIAVTGAIVLLGFIKYFDGDSNGVPDFLERGKHQKPGRPPEFRPQSNPAFPAHGSNGGPARAFTSEVERGPKLRSGDPTPSFESSAGQED